MRRRKAQYQHTRQCCQYRAGKYPHLDLVHQQGAFCKRQVADKQAHGKPYSAQDRYAVNLQPGTFFRPFCQAQADGQQRQAENARLLANKQAQRNADRYRRHQVISRHTGERDPRICEAKQRQYQKRHPRIDAVLQPGKRGLFIRIGYPQRDKERQQDTRDGGVHPGLKHEKPQHAPRQQAG